MQGFNMGRYVPPDHEGTTSANKLHRKHALGARASKLSSRGAVTVRFEMPYAAWCGSCPKPTIIPQGRRFNAEKRRVGAYHSTPVWAFRFRHADCGGEVEMQTDPKNTAYVIIKGATKRDTGEDRPRDGDVVVMTDAEREALRGNAFASLEKTIEDREQLIQATARINELKSASAKHWDDPYRQNQRLRKAFRVGRKEREKEAAAAEDLKDRMSLGIDIVPAHEDDAKRAALVDFAPEGLAGQRDRALSKPLFGDGAIQKAGATTAAAPRPRPARIKAHEAAAAARGEDLASKLRHNTRAAQDPFLVHGGGGNGVGGGAGKPRQARLTGVRGKKSTGGIKVAEQVGSEEPLDDNNNHNNTVSEKTKAVTSGLVSYDDSD